MGGWNFDNTYARLPEPFFVRQNPVPVREPRMAIFNHALAESLGLNAAELAHEPELFSGNKIPAGAEPIAQAYAGHQFGHFTMLGDGRAVLLGEHLVKNQRFDVQLKGSGQTPFSRRGDGRAALGPMLREYIISEAMHGLGIPTTRSLAVVTSGEPVFREGGPLSGAVLTRVAASHIRVGTFEYAAAIELEAPGSLRTLADYTLQRHFPECAAMPEPYLAFLRAVMERQASLIARWMQVGFLHGVMNTDNMALSGETIDYGPCAFLDTYSPTAVFSSIDRKGRYAFGNQARIGEWNLTRLAEALIPLLDPNEASAVAKAKGVLADFSTSFRREWLSGMRAKLGLLREEEGDLALAEDLLAWMEKTKGDYTNTFRALSSDSPASGDEEFGAWHSRWQHRLALEAEPKEKIFQRMRSQNPAVIPRNHRVEEALEAATQRDDFTVLERLLTALRAPFEDDAELSAPPVGGGEGYQTFCGT